MPSKRSQSVSIKRKYKYIGRARLLLDPSIEYLVYREVGTKDFWVTNDKLQYPVKVPFWDLERATRITNERGLKWESAM